MCGGNLFASVFRRGGTFRQWAGNPYGSGCVFSLATGDVVADGLSMPHSPRSVDGLLSFASHMGPPSHEFCQWHGTTPVASYGTTLRVHLCRPKTHSAGPPMPDAEEAPWHSGRSRWFRSKRCSDAG
jgi:hypothetical protein